jgi:hypothetical protein
LAPAPARAYGVIDLRPPKGISPTSVSLQTVLAAVKKADGSDKPASSSIEEGKLTAWDLKGTYRAVTLADDYKSTFDLGLISWQTGRLAGQRWRRNKNGLVILLQGANRPDDIDATAMADYTRHPSADLQLLGETSGVDAAYVVEVHPKDGRVKWLFFDKKSYLLTRAEVPYVDERDIYSYSDFRKTGSRTDPWRIHVSDGHSENDEEYVTTSMRYDAAVTAADMAIPQSNDKLVQFPAGSNVVVLPAQIIGKEGRTRLLTDESTPHNIDMPGDMSSIYIRQESADPHILVQLTINGKGYDFFLDSGASGIFIDSDQAAKMGLQPFGPSQQSALGERSKSWASIPELHVGSITMTNVIVNLLAGWHVDPKVGTQIVGLVGYDFIANAVLAIDYEKGTVTATNPFMFVPPADAIAVPAVLDDGVPFVPVQIGQASSERFILDTGSTNCFLFKQFAQAHPNDIKDQGTGAAVNHFWLPWYGFAGVGGEMPVRATEVDAMTVSGVTFNDWIMFVNIEEEGAAGDSDGLIGYDFLKYFTVYLDYPQNQIFLAPNGLAKNKLGR